jgi:hypothetical protein
MYWTKVDLCSEVVNGATLLKMSQEVSQNPAVFNTLWYVTRWCWQPSYKYSFSKVANSFRLPVTNFQRVANWQ